VRLPARQERQAGRHALVDGIPFTMPVDSRRAPAVMAAFPIDAGRAAALLPGNEVHPLRLPGGRGLLVITVIQYNSTDIGSYIEFSIAIACTYGARPAPPVVPALLRRRFATGQFVLDLPVSTEISVKGGKGIWGMPKHRAYLEFETGAKTAVSRYYLDGAPAVSIEVDRPLFSVVPMSAAAVNYSAFRGLLMKSTIYFRGRGGVRMPLTRAARLTIGDQERVAPLKTLAIAERPLFAAWLPATDGVLDDHFEGWFLTYEQRPDRPPEGLESVVGLGLGRDWPAAP
jgi:Acetoacetate decarboxylase (ADC)